MSSEVLLVSIHPEYAEKIFQGKKTVELRKIRPRLSKGDLIIIYVTSPVKSLAGVLVVESVIEKSPAELWWYVKERCCLSKEDFNEYFNNNEVGFGIFFNEVIEFSDPIKLKNLKKNCPDFRPPQGYHYIDLSYRKEKLNSKFYNILKNERIV